MQSGELKFWLGVVAALACSLAVFAVLLFVALWQYRVIVGACLLLVLVLGAFSGCVVVVRGHTPGALPKSEREP